MAASLAEICAVFPVPGGQYDWTFLLAPPRIASGLSFYVGWMACAAWVALVATGSSLGAQFIIGLISLWHEVGSCSSLGRQRLNLCEKNYVSHPYQTFLIYLAFTIGAFLLNTFGVRLLPLVDRVAFFWSLAGIVIVIITVLATASPNYEPRSFVFGHWNNEVGCSQTLPSF